jgi:hypothetical protein
VVGILQTQAAQGPSPSGSISTLEGNLTEVLSMDALWACESACEYRADGKLYASVASPSVVLTFGE